MPEKNKFRKANLMPNSMVTLSDGRQWYYMSEDKSVLKRLKRANFKILKKIKTYELL